MSDPQSLADRLEAAKARKAAATPAASLESQVAAAEQEAANAEAMAAAVAKYGAINVDVAVVPVITGQVVIVKTPDPAAFSAFMDLKEAKLDDMLAMGARCVVHPSATEFRALSSARPGVIGPVALACAKLAGVALDVQSGKS